MVVEMEKHLLLGISCLSGIPFVCNLQSHMKADHADMAEDAYFRTSSGRALHKSISSAETFQ